MTDTALSLVGKQNATPFPWDGRAERAAVLVADDTLKDEEIAKKTRISRTQLHRWKQHPEFRDRVARIKAELREAALREGIGDKVRRLQALNDRHARMVQVIDERAAEMDGEVAGAGTGLMVRQYKSVGTGERAHMRTEYAVDTGLLKELREHEKQAAQEVGDWTDKHEHSGPNGGPQTFTFVFQRPGDADSD